MCEVKKMGTYEAKDGTCFDTEQECFLYEQSVRDRVVRVCDALMTIYKECSRHTECCEKCLLYVKDDNSHYTCYLQKDLGSFNFTVDRIMFNNK